MEQTLVLIKPDGVQRKLMGEIITRFEKRGLKLVAAKFLSVSQDLAATHYAIHKGKPFYDGLISYITSSPVLAMVWQGPDVVAAVRQTVGATNPLQAAPGTIRHDFGLKVGRNLIHASDANETAQTEIALWFKPEELVDWAQADESWVLESN